MTREIDRLLVGQWGRLRGWIGHSGLLDHGGRPSVLDGWTITELVAHLGRSFSTFAQAQPAEGVEPQTLGRYVSNYPTAAAAIAEGTRELSAELAGDLLGGIDELARNGFAHMTLLTTPVVIGPRGPITRDDFLVTRLLELVVHGDDLARSAPVSPPPLLDDAVAVVAGALGDAYAEVTGALPERDGDLPWIRLATGRTASDDPALPLL